MNSSIPPTILIRRGSAKRWHLGALPGQRRGVEGDIFPPRALCGVSMGRDARRITTYDSRQIDCEDCMIVAIRKGAER